MGYNGKIIALYPRSEIENKMIKIAAKRNPKYHYSPLRYPGGKTFLFPFFDNVIKDHKLKNITYVEPYAGGAGAALALLFLEKVDKIVINDLDRAIYSFWKSAIFNSKKFIETIYSTPVTILEWEKQKKIYKNPHSRGRSHWREKSNW